MPKQCNSSRLPKRRHLMAFVVLTSLSACGPVGGILSPPENFSGKDSLKLRRPPRDFFAAVTEAGKALGYTVSAIDRSINKIDITSRVSGIAGQLIGQYGMTTIAAQLQADRVTVGLEISTMGNFGEGGQLAAEKALDTFKTEFLKRVA